MSLFLSPLRTGWGLSSQPLVQLPLVDQSPVLVDAALQILDSRAQVLDSSSVKVYRRPSKSCWTRCVPAGEVTVVGSFRSLLSIAGNGSTVGVHPIRSLHCFGNAPTAWFCACLIMLLIHIKSMAILSSKIKCLLWKWLVANWSH